MRPAPTSTKAGIFLWQGFDPSRRSSSWKWRLKVKVAVGGFSYSGTAGSGKTLAQPEKHRRPTGNARGILELAPERQLAGRGTRREHPAVLFSHQLQKHPAKSAQPVRAAGWFNKTSAIRQHMPVIRRHSSAAMPSLRPGALLLQ